MKTVDITKKSNIKCEHCRHRKPEQDKRTAWNNVVMVCKNPRSPKCNKPCNYWNRCKAFEWKHEIIDKTPESNQGE